ncbi:MAG: hypothetical protein IT320_26320 [Anaerolineae bacterium]|nr:hypothetical protein [Anaerolineae bacterium]
MNSQANQPYMHDLLAAVTDVMLDNGNVDTVLARYQVSRQEVSGFLSLIEVLHTALTGVKPSRRFAHRLRQDLMGAPRMTVVTRIRKLPPRVQIAASIALVAGFMLLARRRLISDARLQPATEAEAAI